jgi:SsrA-binding protein
MKIITTNRKAKYEYHILDTLEAGIVLKGSEVKSLLNNKISLDGSYVVVNNDEVFLYGAHIDPYSFGKEVWSNHEAKRTRKLLLHKREIQKFANKANQRGFTVIPLKVYFNDNGKIKVEIAVVQGKKLYDKRQAEKKKQANRDMDH